MKLRCENCRRLVLKTDRRRKIGHQLIAMNGAELENFPRQAPRLRCMCGRVIVLLEGRVG